MPVSVTGDAHAIGASVRTRVNVTVPGRPVVLDRVRAEVHQDLREPRPIRRHHRELGRQRVDLDANALTRRPSARACAVTSSSTSATLTGSVEIDTPPASMRDRSRMSSMRRSRCSPAAEDLVDALLVTLGERLLLVPLKELREARGSR